jgi:hypothetical protein
MSFGVGWLESMIALICWIVTIALICGAAEAAPAEGKEQTK